MEFTYQSLDPVNVTKATGKHARKNRTHQGIPGIVRSPGGRLFAVWYAGGDTECCENYVMMVASDDNGKTWSKPLYVVDPPSASVRAFDSTLWLSPEGKLYWFWAQGCGGKSGEWEIYDGIAGVWYSVLENPDDPPEDFRFTPSVRITNGIMMNKPTVLKDGTWCLPISLWTGNYRKHESLGVVSGCWMWVSTDNGKSFQPRGRVDMRHVDGGVCFDEHMFVEHEDGTIQILIRVNKGVAEAFSYDMGFTWTAPSLSHSISGPSSRFFIHRLKSGHLLLVNNDITQLPAGVRRRERMTAYLSGDDGKTWPFQLLLDERIGVSYPDGIVDDDGLICVIYDRDRRAGGNILMARFTEKDILAGKLVSRKSALKILIDESNPVPVKK